MIHDSSHLLHYNLAMIRVIKSELLVYIIDSPSVFPQAEPEIPCLLVTSSAARDGAQVPEGRHGLCQPGRHVLRQGAGMGHTKIIRFTKIIESEIRKDNKKP